MAKIAILGYGVVGSGTVEVFYKNKVNLEQKAGRELDIKYILDIKDCPESPYADKFIKDFGIIQNDPEITVVAELIGGSTFAYDFVLKSLLAGKNVVTSNKELVAEKGAELLRIAREKGVSFFFEASVGGGIPIIRPLHQCLLTDSISSIAGILNGTTNYILTKMGRDGMSFEEALKNAQELGYAESDPTADVEGHDACRKICILASLASGKHVYPDNVLTEGITKITAEDIEYAASAKYAIKLIGSAEFYGDDKKAYAKVCPMLVPEDNQLSGVNDVFNAILVNGDSTGEVLFYGKGAGKYPTASAVVADIINAVKPENAEKTLFWEDSTDKAPRENPVDGKGYYIRALGVTAEEFKKLFGDVTILSRTAARADETAVLVHGVSEAEVFLKIKGIQIENKIRLL